MSDFMKRYWLTLLIPVVVLAIFAALFVRMQGPSSDLPVVMEAPDYTLQDLAGQDVSSADLNGKVRVVEFIFANCTDICPTTTANLVTVQNKLKEEDLFGTDVEFVTITFDPERDTPELLQQYAERMHIDTQGWHLLRGTPEQTKQVTDDFGVYVEKLEDGSFAHGTRSLFLIDQDNNVRKIFTMGEQMETDELYQDILDLAGK